MEGSAAYARSYLKSDLRNTRTLLALIAGDAGALARLEQLAHDVTVGLREQCPADVDVDALRRFVDSEAPAAAREHRLDDDTLRQLGRSLDRVLSWWRALPAVETLLEDARWGEPEVDTLEIRMTPDERFRLLGLPRTRDAIRARFEKYLSKHPEVECLRLVDDEGLVLSLVADDGAVRLAG
jgi:hypothetical protein